MARWDENTLRRMVGDDGAAGMLGLLTTPIALKAGGVALRWARRHPVLAVAAGVGAYLWYRRRAESEWADSGGYEADRGSGYQADFDSHEDARDYASPYPGRGGSRGSSGIRGRSRSGETAGLDLSAGNERELAGEPTGAYRDSARARVEGAEGDPDGWAGGWAGGTRRQGSGAVGTGADSSRSKIAGRHD